MMNVLRGRSVYRALFQWREHRRVGPSQPDSGQTVPGTHRRGQLHWYLCWRHQALDRRSGQHGPLVGPQRGKTTPATWLQQSDILPWLLSHRRLVICRHGEQQCWSPPHYSAGQVSAPSPRELCPQPQVRQLRQVVRLHWQRQSPQRLEDSVRSLNIPVKRNILSAELWHQ